MADQLQRPPDGQHQLHYDMDEVLLYNQRKKLEGKQNGAGSSELGRETKRQKLKDNPETTICAIESVPHAPPLKESISKKTKMGFCRSFVFLRELKNSKWCNNVKPIQHCNKQNYAKS